MNNIEFKKILQSCVSEVGFVYCNKNYYYKTESLVAVINLQKSNYDNSYYINYGFCVRDIHDDLEYPKIYECDIRGRFIDETNTEKNDNFQLYINDSDELKSIIKNNLRKTIIPVINEGIQKYFELFPKAIFSATRSLKEYLEKNVK